MAATVTALRSPPPLVDIASKCGSTVRFVFAGECVRVSCVANAVSHFTTSSSLVCSQQRRVASVPAMRQPNTLSFVLRRYHVAQMLATLESFPLNAHTNDTAPGLRRCHMKDPFFDLQCSVSRDSHAHTRECIIAGVVWDEMNRPIQIGVREIKDPISVATATIAHAPWTFGGSDLVEMEKFLNSSLNAGFGFTCA